MTREEWLEERKKGIGGSDAATILGLNPYKTNMQLWEEKTGRRQAEDISEKEYVKYGTNAEDLLRELFKLDYPKYEVKHDENTIIKHPKYPFLFASLDGTLIDIETGEMGILEIKTTNILQSMQKEKWKEKIPDNYYCQVLWYMGVYEADFAVLKAQLKWERGESVLEVTKHYQIELEEVKDEIDYLMNKGAEFYEYIKTDTCPPLNLPEI